MVNDLIVDYDELAPVLVRKLQGNPNLIVALNTDRRTRYVYMDRALAELKKAEAVRVSFTTVPTAQGP
jgi:biopolymer transport protein ExbD